MSATLEDSANAEFVYIGHSALTADDIRYNEELDKEDEEPFEIASHKIKAKKTQTSLYKYRNAIRRMF